LIISLAMIVKNEQEHINRCLESVKNIVDEIIVVDTGSTDNTMKLVNQIDNIKTFNYEWEDDFSSARNYAINMCKGSYILVLDADEYVTNGNRDELEKIIKNNTIGKICINSKYIKDNQIYSSCAYVSRFFPKEVRYTGSIHEQINSNLPREIMDFRIEHEGYLKPNKGDRNIPLLVKELSMNEKDPYYLFQIGKEYRIKKQYETSYKYLEKSYELINNTSSYYDELVIELIYSGKECNKVKVLGIIDENNQLLSNISDFHFAKGLFYLDYCLKNPKKASSYIHSIEKSFKTCISLRDQEHIEYVKGTSSFLASYNLGVFYEVIGQINKAKRYYQQSYSDGYLPSKTRLEGL